MATVNILRLSGRGVQKLLSPHLMRSSMAATAMTQKQVMILPSSQYHGKSRFSDPTTWGAPEKQHLLPSKEWTAEKFLSIGMIVLLPTTIAFPHAALDTATAACFILHAHLGLDAVFVDYVHRKLISPKVCDIFFTLFAIAAFGSLCYFNYNDVGIGNALRMIWAL